MIINNIFDLAKNLEVKPEQIPEHFRKFTDYTTCATVNEKGLTLKTRAELSGFPAQESAQEHAVTLLFPFTDDTLSDAVSGLQCLADAEYWTIEH